MADSNNLRRNILISLALALITLGIYWPVAGFEFNNYDDNIYVTENAHLPAGFTTQNLVWAFTTGYASNWHPVTWLSHMVDVQLYGLNPAGHHLTNLCFHVANSLLLFGLLLQLTGQSWRSAIVAALFAWHPMHVESVAWVAERKDVLSAFFGLLTLWAYLFYVRVPTWPRYGLVLGCFALGLMAKPMLVTLPLILLLLDFWPLGRMTGYGWPKCDEQSESTALLKPLPPARLLAEKIPFFALTALSCGITFIVQKTGGAMVLTHLPFSQRMANALVACMRYIGKLVWPHDMAVLYPYNYSLPLWQVMGAGLVLALACSLALRVARRRPYLTVGWFWFVITLVPVIGLVQVGEQSMADRYTYIPATGLFLLVVWAAAEALSHRTWSKWVLSLVVTLILSACLFITARQLRYWQNSITLFTHAIQVTAENATPHNNLGGALTDQGKYEEAVAQFNLALKLRPDWDMPHNNLGIALINQGKVQDAVTHFRTAIKLNPQYAEAFVNLGIALARQGKLDEAITQYQHALKISPNAEAHNRLGGALQIQGKFDEAALHYASALDINSAFAEAHVNLASILNAQGKFEQARDQLLSALRYKPNLAAAHYHLGNTLAGLGELDRAASQYLTALQLQPDDSQAHFNLANLLARQKQWDSAQAHYSEALRLQPDLVQAHVNLAIILNQHGSADKAIDHYRAALLADPHSMMALENLAWILATHPNPKLRDGAESVRLSTLTMQLAGPAADATAWDIQAAACAEAGQFAGAVSAAKRAIDLAKTSQNKELAAQLQTRLQRYEAGQAFHEGSAQQ